MSKEEEDQRQLGAAVAPLVDKIADRIAAKLGGPGQGGAPPVLTKVHLANDDWYKTWAAGAALAISTLLLISLKSLLTASPGPLVTEPGTFFRHMTGTSNGARFSCGIAATQWFTILCFSLASMYFVWNNACYLAEKPGQWRVLSEATVYSLAAFCAMSATSRPWVFRGALALGGIIWWGRLLMDRKRKPFKSAFIQYPLAFVGLFLVESVITLIPLALKGRVLDRSTLSILSDVTFTYVPVVLSAYALFQRTMRVSDVLGRLWHSLFGRQPTGEQATG